MIPWEEIDRAEIPGHEGEVTLRKRGTEFSIRTAGTELMNSRHHGSVRKILQIDQRGKEFSSTLPPPLAVQQNLLPT